MFPIITIMKFEDLYHNYEIIEYFERLSAHDQEILISDGENNYNAVLSCGEFEEIEQIIN